MSQGDGRHLKQGMAHVRSVVFAVKFWDMVLDASLQIGILGR